MPIRLVKIKNPNQNNWNQTNGAANLNDSKSDFTNYSTQEILDLKPMIRLDVANGHIAYLNTQLDVDALQAAYLFYEQTQMNITVVGGD